MQSKIIKMKKLIFTSLLFISVNSYSQTLPSDYSINENNQSLNALNFNTNFLNVNNKSKKDDKDFYKIAKIKNVAFVGTAALFTSLLVMFTKSLVTTIKLNKNG